MGWVNLGFKKNGSTSQPFFQSTNPAERSRHWHVHLNTPRSKESNLVVVWLPNKKGRPKKAQTSCLSFFGWVGLGWLVGCLVFWLVSWLAGWLVWCWCLPSIFFATANMADFYFFAANTLWTFENCACYFLLETDMLNPKNSVWGSSYEFSGSKFWLIEIQFFEMSPFVIFVVVLQTLGVIFPVNEIYYPDMPQMFTKGENSWIPSGTNTNIIACARGNREGWKRLLFMNMNRLFTLPKTNS